MKMHTNGMCTVRFLSKPIVLFLYKLVGIQTLRACVINCHCNEVYDLLYRVYVSTNKKVILNIEQNNIEN